MYRLRIKTLSSDGYSPVKESEDLMEIINYISINSADIKKAEIVKNNELFFVFAVDAKTRMLLSFLQNKSTSPVKVSGKKRVKK
jgi:hypothetical protein